MDNNNDDLNLLELFIRFSRFLKKNKLFITILFLIYFSIGAFYYFFIKKNEYQSKLTATTKVLETEDVNSIIQTINTYIKGKEYEKLSLIFKIEIEDVKSLKGIGTDYLDFNDPKQQELDKNKNKKFVITIKSTNNLIFEKLNKPILDYIKQSELYKTSSMINKSKSNNISLKLEKLISQLDTLNPKLFDNYKSNNSKYPSIFLSNPGSLSETILNLIIENEEVKENLIYETEIIVIEPFRNFYSVENKYYNKFYFSMIIISFILSILTINITSSYSKTKSK